jgi:hypothetical protein
MTVVLGFFWFLCAALWMFLIATTIRPKVAEAVRRDHITLGEGRTFLRGLAISIGFGSGVLGMIALVADRPAPFCIEPFLFHDWSSAASTGFILIAWGALLGWVWLGSGADLLGRIAPAFANAPRWRRQYSPWSVRVVVTLLLAGAAGGALLGTRTVAADQATVCADG